MLDRVSDDVRTIDLVAYTSAGGIVSDSTQQYGLSSPPTARALLKPQLLAVLSVVEE
jgi:hypothetical protein